MEEVDARERVRKDESQLSVHAWREKGGSAGAVLVGVVGRAAQVKCGIMDRNDGECA